MIIIIMIIIINVYLLRLHSASVKLTVKPNWNVEWELQFKMQHLNKLNCQLKVIKISWSVSAETICVSNESSWTEYDESNWNVFLRMKHWAVSLKVKVSFRQFKYKRCKKSNYQMKCKRLKQYPLQC